MLRRSYIFLWPGMRSRLVFFFLFLHILVVLLGLSVCVRVRYVNSLQCNVRCVLPLGVGGAQPWLPCELLLGVRTMRIY